MSSPLADITHVSSPSSNGQNSPLPSGSNQQLHQHHQQHQQMQQQHEQQSLKDLGKSSSLEMRPPSAVSGHVGGVTSPLSCHSPMAVSSVISNPAASVAGSSYFTLPLIKDEDLASVGSGASGQSRVLGGDSAKEGEEDSANDLEGDSKLVDSIEYESILEAEENYKELVEREWQQSR